MSNDHDNTLAQKQDQEYFGARQCISDKFIVVLHRLQIRITNNFIIIIDMSSGSLISSLFRDNSFTSRSNSMFHKSFFNVENKQERSRSQSAYPDKNTNNQTSKYLPVARMTHMLAVKVKKLNYFLFCRLEANLKKQRADTAQQELAVIAPKVEQIASVPQNSKKQKQKGESLREGAHSLAQIFQLHYLKGQNSCIQNTFKTIKTFSQNKQACSAILKIIGKNYRNKLSTCFKNIHDRQKFVLRAQIFSEANVHVFQPKFKEIFKRIRQFAIDNKIKMEQQERSKKQHEKQQRGKFINMDELYLGAGSTRLKSISEEGSSILSEEETARFTTPEKSRTKKGKDYAEDMQKSKTSRKQARNLVLTRKQTRKQYDEIEKYQYEEVLNSNMKKYQEQSNKSLSIRASTKKQPQRSRINFGKSYKVETCLFDSSVIQFKKTSQSQSRQSMLKNNRLYVEAQPIMVPDLHDNMGVFEDMWAEQSNRISPDNSFTHRTIDKCKSQWIDIQSSKATNCCKASESKAIVVEDPQNFQLYDLRSTENFNVKQNTRTNACSRAMTNCLSSPKFCVQPGNDGVLDDIVRQDKPSQIKDKFYSSPLCKIEEMMVDLEKLRQREKYSAKYISGYQKCKLSVNLPKKSYEGRSYQVSASKTNVNSSKTGFNECRSDKKSQNKQSIKRYPDMDRKQQKENIEVKLWEERQKFFFYAEPTNSIKQRKKSSGFISSVNQSQINTARKMKKQIESIINNRKSRTSLGGLKIAKSKY